MAIVVGVSQFVIGAVHLRNPFAIKWPIIKVCETRMIYIEVEVEIHMMR